MLNYSVAELRFIKQISGVACLGGGSKISKSSDNIKPPVKTWE